MADEIHDIFFKVESLLKGLGCEFDICWGWSEIITGDPEGDVRITVKIRIPNVI